MVQFRTFNELHLNWIQRLYSSFERNIVDIYVKSIDSVYFYQIINKRCNYKEQ